MRSIVFKPSADIANMGPPIRGSLDVRHDRNLSFVNTLILIINQGQVIAGLARPVVRSQRGHAFLRAHHARLAVGRPASVATARRGAGPGA